MLSLSGLQSGSYHQKALYFPRRGVPLHAMVTSCGYSRETSTAYDWDGIKRGNAEFVLLQYTLDGVGRLQYEGADYTVGPGQAMLLHFPHQNRGCRTGSQKPGQLSGGQFYFYPGRHDLNSLACELSETAVFSCV